MELKIKFNFKQTDISLDNKDIDYLSIEELAEIFQTLLSYSVEDKREIVKDFIVRLALRLTDAKSDKAIMTTGYEEDFGDLCDIIKIKL